jgi:chromosome segregation ATPase
MQLPSPDSIPQVPIALWIVAWFLSQGGTTAIIIWLLNRRKYKAEVVSIQAQDVKVAAEANQISAQTLMTALERIRELVEINVHLQEEKNEAGRERDNFEFELQQALRMIQKYESEISSYETQLKRMDGILKARGLSYDEKLNVPPEGLTKP